MTFTETSVRTEWGAELTVFAEDASHFGDFLTTGVSWAHETRLLRELVLPGMTVFDVGANLGYCASLFADRVGPAGLVVALEPEPVMADLLDRNMRSNGHECVRVVRAAAGGAPGTTALWRSGTNLACHSTNVDLVPAVTGRVEVSVTTVDDLAGQWGAPDVVKIDVEGWEWSVLCGMRATLRRHPLLWLEFWPDGLRANGHDPHGLPRALDRAGYDVTMVDLLTGARTPATDTDPVAYCDRMGEDFRRAGRTDLYGIVYLLARPR
ncbi:FkbM family methyltransferase [Actinophytocola oryzae]|uniref:FkbM family methyltransferase n=1 Tax=Actinophytocola oryzae TaxID=502181 RepID=A0A4R7VH84_9PSEU|nr:FkbM family methyltransferase [Actinophytocola oryzae]TDV48696.1 FkbM family methyltransferase [Actinophytocola oryzae]